MISLLTYDVRWAESDLIIIMSKLTNAIVATASADAVKSAIVDVFGDFDERVQTILAEKVLGVFEMPEIPVTSNVAKDATLVKYNLLDDKVDYTYTRVETRYFEDIDSADHWADGHSGYSGCYAQDDRFTVEATRERQDSSSCSLHRWLNK